MVSNIHKYIAFVTVVQQGSISKAAEILQYTQSTVSKMIQDLENDWNVTLLQRNKNGVKLTSDGYNLFPFIKNMYSDYERLQSQINELNGLQTGLIRIGTFSSVATHWLPRIISEFKKDYPNIRFELVFGNYPEIEDWLVEGSIDCGFLRLPVQSSVDAMFLEKDEFLAVLPQNHPLADCDTFPMQSLSEYPFLLLGRNNITDVSSILKYHNITPDIPITTVDDYAILSFVESGFGISILPRLILNRIPYNVIVKSLDVPAYREIGFVVRQWDTASIALKYFKNYLHYRNK